MHQNGRDRPPDPNRVPLRTFRLAFSAPPESPIHRSEVFHSWVQFCVNKQCTVTAGTLESQGLRVRERERSDFTSQKRQVRKRVEKGVDALYPFF